MPRLKRRLIGITGGAALLFATYGAAQVFITERIIAWSETQSGPANAKAAIAMLRDREHRLSASEVHAAIARRYIALATNTDAYGLHRLINYRLAAKEFLVQTETRPTWPYGFASAAHNEFAGRVPTKRLLAQLRRAQELGANEPGVWRMLVDVGLGRWADWDATTRAQIEAAIDHYAHLDAHAWVRLVGTRGRDNLGFACMALMNVPPHIEKYCNAYRSGSKTVKPPTRR